jgi:hypothetical protein
MEHNKIVFERVRGRVAPYRDEHWHEFTTKIENFSQNIRAVSIKFTHKKMAELEKFASKMLLRV